MVNASIKINGTLGSVDNLSTGVSVSLSNNDNSGVTSWYWEFLSVPPSSASAILTPTASTASFTPDKVGSYLIKLTVQGGGDSDTDQVIGAVLTPTLGVRIPSARETTEFNSVLGWSDAIYDAFVAFDAYSPVTHAIGGPVHTSSTLAELNTKISDATLDDSSSSRPPSGSASGDLSGTYPSPTVSKIQNYSVSSNAPSPNYVLMYKSSVWTPSSLPIDGYAEKTLLDGYLALDGSNAMNANIDVGGFNIVNVSLVDGYDLPAQFQSISNDDAYQDSELININTNLNNHTTNTSNPHQTDIGNLGSGTLAELNSIITDATIIGTSSLDSYLALDGSDSMSGNFDVGGNNIVNVNLVDGYDLPAQFQSISNDDAYQDSELISLNTNLNSHINNTSNPHQTDIGNLGSGTFNELNNIITDATLIDVSFLDSYLALNGSDSMSGNFDVGGNNIINVNLVDGYDLPAQFQSISNDDAYQDEQLTNINTNLNNHTTNTSNPHQTDIGNLGSGTLGELNSIITDANLTDITYLDSYLAVDGHIPMAGNLDMDGYDIINVGLVDGYDLPTQFQSISNDDAYQDGQLTIINTNLNSHITNLTNPHQTSISNIGNGTLQDLNDAITDATLIDISLLDSYLALDGSDSMSGDFDVGENNIINVNLVDGYDLPSQFQSISNDDAYQDEQLTTINTNLNSHITNTSNPHSTDIGNLGSGTLGELNSIITDATLIDISHLDSYLALDGLDIMFGNLDMGGYNIINVNLVDGYDLPSQFQSISNDDAYQNGQLTTINTNLNSHISNLVNPHQTSISNIGNGTLQDLNDAITDATLIDISHLDSYLALDGSDSMSGNLDLGNNNIVNVNLVDGYDLPAQFQSISNDDAYQDSELISLNTNLNSHTTNTNNPHQTDIENLGSGTLAELNDAITDATLADISLLDSYLATDGSNTMLANLDMGGFSISNVNLVDGYDLPAQFQSITNDDAYQDGQLTTINTNLNSHIANINNPHSVSINQAFSTGSTILATNNPLYINANGGSALDLDGYITFTETTDPTPLQNSGMIYTKDVLGITELFYIDNAGSITQITDDGYLNETHSYGEMYISSSSATTTSQTPTYTKIAGTYTDGYLSNFTHSSGTLTYTGTEAKFFEINAQISATSSSTDVFYFRIGINGNTIAKTEGRRRISSVANEIGSISLCSILELSQNDYIEMFVTRQSASAANVTAEKMVITLHSI